MRPFEGHHGSKANKISVRGMYHITVILKRCFIHKLHVINVDLMKSVIFIRALMQVLIPMRHKEKLIEITANP